MIEIIIILSPLTVFLIYLFWPLLARKLRPYISILNSYIPISEKIKRSVLFLKKIIEKNYPLVFFGLGIFIFFYFATINFIDDRKYLEFKKDFYTKNASILKPSNFNEIQQIQNIICRTKLHNNANFDRKIKQDVKRDFFLERDDSERDDNAFVNYINRSSTCAPGYIVLYIEKNLNPLQIRNDILFRQYRLNYYSSNIEIGLKCAHYNSWGVSDRFALGYNDTSYFWGFYNSKDVLTSEHYYNLYQSEYSSLRNLLSEKIKNTELINNTPLLENKILEEITSKNKDLNYENKLNKQFRSQECDLVRNKNREIDLAKKQKEDPLAKKLGRAVRSAKDSAEDVINPLKNKADKLFDQFKDGFNN